MKLFTKVALGIAGFFAGIAVICLVISFAMGFTWSDFRTMVADGKFAFGPEDGLQIHLFDEDDIKEELILKFETGKDDSEGHHEEGEYQKAVPHACEKLYIEYGAGKLDVRYADVSTVQVIHENVEKFSLTTSEEEKSVYISGALGVTDESDAALTILIPMGTELEKLDLEIGASQANLDGIIADEICITVGAGEASVSNLSVVHLDLEVGAGYANITGLCVGTLDVEAGVGEVDIEIAGVESDYNYSVECGIGEVNVGNHTYGGVGAEQTITNPEAQHHVNIECGIGEVNMHFTGCNVNDGTCEEGSHNHHDNTH